MMAASPEVRKLSARIAAHVQREGLLTISRSIAIVWRGNTGEKRAAKANMPESTNHPDHTRRRVSLAACGSKVATANRISGTRQMAAEGTRNAASSMRRSRRRPRRKRRTEKPAVLWRALRRPAHTQPSKVDMGA